MKLDLIGKLTHRERPGKSPLRPFGPTWPSANALPETTLEPEDEGGDESHPEQAKDRLT